MRPQSCRSTCRARIDWEEAFAFYCELRPWRRSYRAVAERFGVSLTSVKKHGKRERWTHRFAAIDERARARLDRRMVSMLVDRNAHRLKAQFAAELEEEREAWAKT